MGDVIPIDENKALPTNRAVIGGNVFPNESPELRNKSVGYNPELDRAVAEAELEILLKNLDVSEINQQGTNDQRQVLNRVKTDFEAGDFFSALARLIREDIQLTNRTLWMFLRLNRVYQGQRTGTTDMEEMADVRNNLREEKTAEELIGNYSGLIENKEAVKMALKTVANGEKGTTEVGLDDLQIVQQMVRDALKAELKNKYEDIVSLEGSQHGLSGLQSPGIKDMDPIRGSFNNNEKVNSYLRLYEALTVELLDKQQRAVEKDTALKFEKADVLASLGKLQKSPGVAIDESMLKWFEKKISTMDMDQLKYFDFKILELFNQVSESEKTSAEANNEIAGWLNENRKFSKKELHDELEERKAQNKKQDQQVIEALRTGKVVKMPIRNQTIKTPIEPGEKAA